MSGLLGIQTDLYVFFLPIAFVSMLRMVFSRILKIDERRELGLWFIRKLWFLPDFVIVIITRFFQAVGKYPILKQLFVIQIKKL